MDRRRTWIIGALCIAAAWAVAIAVIAVARGQAVTAEKVRAFVEANPLSELEGEDRTEHIEALAERMNRLPFDERQDPAVQSAARRQFLAMTPEERLRYLDLVLPRGMQQMMEAINDMPRDERKKLVDRALADMQGREGDERRGRMEEQVGGDAMQKIVDEGLRSYLSDASPEAKLDLEPLVLQMQRNLQRAHR